MTYCEDLDQRKMDINQYLNWAFGVGVMNFIPHEIIL